MLALSMTSALSGAQSTVKVSSAPLTKEQIAVYRVLLNDFLQEWKDYDKAIDLEDQTVPLDWRQTEACLRGLDFSSKRSRGTLHSIGGQLPSTLKEGAANSSGSSDDSHVASAVGALSLSEIAFDKAHRYALVGYEFHCGVLCGEKVRILFEKVNGTWRREHNCSVVKY